MKPFFYEASLDSFLKTHFRKNAAALRSIMEQSVSAFGGRVVACHLSSVNGDPIGFLEFEEDISARAWSIWYATQDGVITSHISRMLDDDDLKKAAELIKNAPANVSAHRR